MKTFTTARAGLLGILFSTAVASGSAFAQDVAPTPVPDHPRINEVNQRVDNQENRIDKGVADGQINARQEARDDRHLNNVEQRESRDEAKNGGHLTKGEQRRLNRSLNHNSRRIYRQRH